MHANFRPGRNIAMKVPPHQHAATVAFYADVLGLERIARDDDAVGFHFGDKQLWIDNVPGMSQAELWLEVVTDDIEAAARALAKANVVRCDAIEPLSADFKAFWIASPAAIVHLVCQDNASW